MNTSRAKYGPFRERLHYSAEEIEHVTEQELKKFGLLPSSPTPINIDRYVEQRFITPRYEELRPTLLGYTEFGPNGPKDIVINKELASDPSPITKRRVRTTIAHEAGHALLHTTLYQDSGQTSLLPAQQDEHRILCKEEDFHRNGYDGKWWEYQANLAMSTFLLPKKLTITAIQPYLTLTPLGGRVLDPHNAGRATRALAHTFDVNPIVARIRIEHIFKT